MAHCTPAELEAALPAILAAPRGRGTLERIVRRPTDGQREVLDEAQLDIAVGLVGDRWCIGTPEKPPHPGKQITIMRSRVAALLAGGGDWAPAGDQLYVELDLTEAQVPAGTRLSIGGAVVEVTADPHVGCKKFAERFGLDALAWCAAPANAHLRLRGLHARVLVPGTIRRADPIIVADT